MKNKTKAEKKIKALAVRKSVSPTKSELKKNDIDTLRQTVCPTATFTELKMFLYTCQRVDLDPFLHQIYLVKRRDNKTGDYKATIQVGIDGLRSIAEKTGKYAGSDDAVFESGATKARPTKATVTIYKMVEQQRCAFTASARWSEYFPGDKLGFMWTQKPFLMLGKVAEALALRKAFPLQTSGLYVTEEMDKANVGKRVETGAVEVIESAEKEYVVQPTQERQMTPDELFLVTKANILRAIDVSSLERVKAKIQKNDVLFKEQKEELFAAIAQRIGSIQGK